MNLVVTRNRGLIGNWDLDVGRNCWSCTELTSLITGLLDWDLTVVVVWVEEEEEDGEDGEEMSETSSNEKEGTVTNKEEWGWPKEASSEDVKSFTRSLNWF